MLNNADTGVVLSKDCVVTGTIFSYCLNLPALWWQPIKMKFVLLKCYYLIHLCFSFVIKKLPSNSFFRKCLLDAFLFLLFFGQVGLLPFVAHGLHAPLFLP